MSVTLTSYFESLDSGSNGGIEESMSNNLLRLSSFSNFPRHINIFASRFTGVGFYFTGYSDTVKCYSCGVSRSSWISSDVPLEIHKRLNPNCPHLQNLNSQNVVQNLISSSNSEFDSNFEQNRISNVNTYSDINYSQNIESHNGAWTKENNSITQVSGQSGHFETSTTAVSYTQNGVPNNISNCFEASKKDRFKRNNHSGYFKNAKINTDDSVSNTNNETNKEPRTPSFFVDYVTRSNSSTGVSCNNNRTESIQTLGINLETPKYSNYAPMQVRISSYHNWPGYLDQTPKMMASAGFFYAGFNDYTRCFFCGGGLQSREAGDDPWIEHARWFPKCAYLYQNKGEKFIKIVQEKHKQVMAEHNNFVSPNVSASTYASSENKQNQKPVLNTNIHLSSQNPLETVAARSVLEMGYTHEQIRQSIEKVKTFKQDTNQISATEIMRTLLEVSLEGNADLTNSTETAQHMIPESTFSNQSSLECNVSVPAYPNRSKASSTGNQTISPNELTPIKGPSGESLSNEIASAMDVTEILAEENRLFRDQRLCQVCLNFEASIAFLPCGHLVCCADCAPAIRKCPICSARVKGTVKTF